MFRIVSRVAASGLLLAIFGCSSPSTRSSVSLDEYAFFSATRTDGGYDVHRINAEAERPVHVRAIDLAPAGFASDDAATILGEVGSDPSATRLLFVGRLATDAAGSTLSSYEVWRGPREAKLDRTAFHVSHSSSQTLGIGEWRPLATNAVDLAAAPTIAECDDPTNAECAPSHAWVEEDAGSPAGIVVLGTFDGGTLHASDWYVKVIVGFEHRADGYGYCAVDQTTDATNHCIGAPLAPKGRGRGLLAEDLSLRPKGHGRGLHDMGYVRTDDGSAQDWLLATSQLHPGETP